ncbi:hypothetical protein, partial [Leptospira wolffii]
DTDSAIFFEKFKSYYYLIRKKIIKLIDGLNTNHDLEILEILDCISKGYHKPESISNSLLINLIELRENLMYLRRKMLIDEKNNMTLLGKNTLKELRRKHSKVFDKPNEDYINYIPRSFGGQ